MAGSSVYKDDDDAAAITDINVTPFVDVVLVLLVVFIVTAKLIIARGVEIDKPKAASGADVQATLKLTIRSNGDLFIGDKRHTTDPEAIARIKEIAATTTKPKAIVAGDRAPVYAGVMHAIDLVLQAGVTAIALENERP